MDKTLDCIWINEDKQIMSFHEFTDSLKIEMPQSLLGNFLFILAEKGYRVM